MASNPHYKQALLNSIAREWTALWNAVDLLTPEQMLTPDAGGWSPKDNLAHLSEWIKVLMGYHMDKRPSHEVLGVSPDVVKNWNFTVINPILFERNRNRSAEDVLAELKTVYAQLIVRLENITFDDLLKQRHADDPAMRPLVLWVLGNTTEHFAEHRITIEKMLKEQQ
jgi:hypothetical protein